MGAGDYVYLADSSGHIATLTESGALTVQLASGLTVSVQLSGATIEISGNRVYSVGQSGIPYSQDSSGRQAVEAHITSGNIIVSSITASPNVYVVDRMNNQASNVNPLSQYPVLDTHYGVVTEAVLFLKEGRVGDGTTDFSLAYTSISGNGALKVATSGLNTVTVTSGLYIVAPPTNVGRTRAAILLDDNSGGTLLASGDCEGLLIKNFANSSGDVYLGYSNERPYSGVGYAIQPGESLTLDINNFNKIAVVGTISGFCKVTYTGMAFV